MKKRTDLRVKVNALLLTMCLLVAMIPSAAFAAVPEEPSVDPQTEWRIVEEYYRTETGTVYSSDHNRRFDYTADHYKVYQVRVGNSNIKHFLYDLYQVDWVGRELVDDDEWKTVTSGHFTDRDVIRDLSSFLI